MNQFNFVLSVVCCYRFARGSSLISLVELLKPLGNAADTLKMLHVLL